MVYRIYVEKKNEFAHEAGSLLSDIKGFLGIAGVEKVRVINRYDVENIDKELFDYCVNFRQGTPAEVVKKRQGEGKISTWYTCCAERFPNSFMVSPLEQAYAPHPEI